MKTIFGGIGMSFTFFGFIFMVWSLFSGTSTDDFIVYSIIFFGGLALLAISLTMKD